MVEISIVVFVNAITVSFAAGILYQRFRSLEKEVHQIRETMARFEKNICEVMRYHDELMHTICSASDGRRDAF